MKKRYLNNDQFDNNPPNYLENVFREGPPKRILPEGYNYTILSVPCASQIA